ncbi:MAG: ATP-dependent DNA ligase [Methanocellales archaeon]
MKYLELIEALERVAKIASKNEKVAIISELLKKSQEQELKNIARLLVGKIFPDYESRELGISTATITKVLSEITGKTQLELIQLHRQTGDLGGAAEVALKSKRQFPLFKEALEISEVYSAMEEIAEIKGEDSFARISNVLKGLLLRASPIEAKYLIRTLLGNIQVGFSQGLMEDAIARAFEVSKAKVMRALMYMPDVGEIAALAQRGNKALDQVEIQLLRPVKPMLASHASSLEEIFEEFKEFALEVKYDGIRVQIHKKDAEIKIFTRRLRDITSAVPDLIEKLKQIKAENFILEGELIAVKEGKLLPFQELVKRIQRKYEIEEMSKLIPLNFLAFDVLYLNGANLTKMKYKFRYAILEDLLNGSGIDRAERIVASNLEEARAFFERARTMGHEGLMAKDMNAPYSPGTRGRKMLKLKSFLDTLDVAVLAAEYGEGRKHDFLSRYFIGAKSGDEFVVIGKVSSGLSDEELEWMTDELRKDAVEETGRLVKVKPRIVLEVAFDEIQKGESYPSGYALRFPRVLRIRDDKEIDEVDSVDRIKELYECGGELRID